MTTSSSFNYIFNIFKLAARDLPRYFPNWVRRHNQMRKVKELASVEKSIPIENYRETLPPSSPEEIKKEAKIERLNQANFLKMYITSIIFSYIEILNKEIESAEASMSAAEISEDSKIKLAEKIKVIRAFINLANQLGHELRIAVSEFNSNYDKIFQESGRKITKIFEIKNNISSGFEKTTPVGVKLQSINYGSGTSIFTILSNLVTNLERFANVSITGTNREGMVQIHESQPYKQLAYLLSEKYEQEVQKSFEGGEIVFSKNPVDILTMSSRSDWTSCQDLIRKNRDSQMGFRERAIHAALSKNVGIIYLTNKKDYESRGEEMIARCLVFCLENVYDPNDQVISLTKVYGNANRDGIEEIFERSINKHSPLRVIDESEVMDKNNPYFLPVKSKFTIPYFDNYGHRGMVRGKRTTQIINNNSSVVERINPNLEEDDLELYDPYLHGEDEDFDPDQEYNPELE